MDKSLMVAEIEQTRQAMIGIINNTFDRLFISLENQQNDQSITSDEYIVPLTSNPSIFVGKKPAAVLFGEVRVETKTWKMVFETILNHCNQDPVYHSRLMDLRGKASGKVRVFLSKSTKGMRRPMKISEDLYAEIHYGSQTLMSILVNRILAPIHYDYSDIGIVLRMSQRTGGG